MAESTIAEYPVTPERIDQCPATPDCRLSSKNSDSSPTTSDNDCPQNGRSTGSPPPNCAICLGKYKNKSFTDSCLHQFCFKCLLEWSKVKAECPLCKQAFKSIIHNVKSIDQFEEYLVRPQQSQTIPIPRSMALLNPRTTTRFTQFATTRRSHSSSYPHRFDVFLSDMPRFSATVRVHPSDDDAFQQIFLERTTLLGRLRREYANESSPLGTIGQMWRGFIYEKKLYALPVVDITGRFRECSARFYRDNPAQKHRLMPWLSRDLAYLLRETEHHVSYVLQILSDLLTVYNIKSPEFRRRCQPYLRRKTSHFIHEFVNFARSPYDIIGYDREVRYAPYYEEVVLATSSNSTSSSDNDENTSGRVRERMRGRTQFRLETISDFSRFILAERFSRYPSLPPFDITSDELINAAVESTDRSTGERNPTQILEQNDIFQSDRDIVVSSTSSDECEFVLERKPPHLRTPEMITLNSESDSDVVFVSENRSKSVPPNSAVMKQVAKNRKRKLPKGVFISTLSDSLSNSDEENHIQSSNTRAKTENKEVKVNNTESGEIGDESNVGASTSSDVRNTDSGCKKYYARPVRRTRHESRRTVKSIYEDSSSDTDCSTCDERDSSQSSCSTSNYLSSNYNSDTDSSWSGNKSKRRLKRKRAKRSKRKRIESGSKKKKSKESRRKSHKRKKSTRQRIKRSISSSSSSSTSPSRPPKTKSNEGDLYF